VAIIDPVPLSGGTLFAVPGQLVVMATSLLLINIFAHLNTRFIAHMAAVGMLSQRARASPRTLLLRRAGTPRLTDRYPPSGTSRARASPDQTGGEEAAAIDVPCFFRTA
jgi:hypothetical protein